MNKAQLENIRLRDAAWHNPYQIGKLSQADKDVHALLAHIKELEASALQWSPYYKPSLDKTPLMLGEPETPK